MKKLIFKSLALFAAIALTACGGKSDKKTVVAEDGTADTVTVDEVLENPGEYIDKVITVDGVCSHLCRHGGRKAFLAGSADNHLLRCEAYPVMGYPFAAETIHRPIRVTGTLREERIDYKTVDEMEWAYNEKMLNDAAASNGQGGDRPQATSGAECDTEQAARGQAGLTDFEARLADYRARIAAREAAEGLPYLSFYYLEASSYTLD